MPRTAQDRAAPARRSTAVNASNFFIYKAPFLKVCF
jgi:hypothetical protein